MPDNIKIVAIGSGNVASHLIPALNTIGCKITQVYSRSLLNANKLAHLIGTESIDQLEKIDTTADIYLVMVNDDLISSVCDQMPILAPDQILAHTSGAIPIDILSAYTNNYGSFYPLESFKKEQLKAIDNVPFLVNGNNACTTRTLRILARKLSNKVTECSDVDRLKYHLSAVLINNFTNHLACLSDRFLTENALDPSFLNAIIETSFKIIKDGKACTSQTGPAMRSDFQLMKNHLELIKQDPHLSKVYKTLSDSIISYYKKESHENS